MSNIKETYYERNKEKIKAYNIQRYHKLKDNETFMRKRREYFKQYYADNFMYFLTGRRREYTKQYHLKNYHRLYAEKKQRALIRIRPSIELSLNVEFDGVNKGELGDTDSEIKKAHIPKKVTGITKVKKPRTRKSGAKCELRNEEKNIIYLYNKHIKNQNEYIV